MMAEGSAFTILKHTHVQQDGLSTLLSALTKGKCEEKGKEIHNDIIKGKQRQTKAKPTDKGAQIFINKCQRNYFYLVMIKNNFWILKREEVKWLFCEEY